MRHFVPCRASLALAALALSGCASLGLTNTVDPGELEAAETSLAVVIADVGANAPEILKIDAQIAAQNYLGAGFSALQLWDRLKDGPEREHAMDLLNKIRALLTPAERAKVAAREVRLSAARALRKAPKSDADAKPGSTAQ